MTDGPNVFIDHGNCASSSNISVILVVVFDIAIFMSKKNKTKLNIIDC